MTSGQRKVHKISWILIAIVIPVLIFFSTKNLTFFESKEGKEVTIEASKKNALKVVENEQIKASLFESSVEIILKSSLKTSSSVVYTMNENGEKGNLLGQVATVGIYDFIVEGSVKGIVVFDKIKEVEITKLSF